VWTRRRVIQAGVALGISLLWPAFTYSPKSSLQAVRDALMVLRRQRLVLSPLEGLIEFRGVLHAHTSLSHDSHGTVEEIIAAARQARLHFLITTDHYTTRIYSEGIQGVHNSVLVIRGVEIGMGCTRSSGLTRRCGSVLAFGCRDPLMADDRNGWDWEALFKTIRAQRGLSIIAHPRGLPDSGYFKQADGMEIYDIADAMREKIIDVPRELLQFALTSDKYPEEIMLAVVERMNWHLAQWDTLTRDRRFVGVAGNDAHQNLALLGRQLDRYDLIFRALNMHVLAPSLTEENIIAGLREGRCFASFGLLGDAAGFQFIAREIPTGAQRAVLGGELKMQDGLVLEVQSPIPGSLILLRDGVPIRREEGRLLRHGVDRPGVYRVEVALRVLDRWRPWIFANPIYIRA
jgi:hypothetical protein